MTPEDRRLLALATLFHPARAAALLSGMSPPLPGLEAGVDRLASRPRSERLAALARALSPDAAVARAVLEAARIPERPRISALLGKLAHGEPIAGPSPALVRLCRERIAC